MAQNRQEFFLGVLPWHRPPGQVCAFVFGLFKKLTHTQRWVWWLSQSREYSHNMKKIIAKTFCCFRVRKLSTSLTNAMSVIARAFFPKQSPTLPR
jgi:hypothetical protein